MWKPILLSLIGLGAAPVCAQSTLVVSSTPGPGVDFTSLGTAVLAATPGDRIEIRPGSYQPVNIRKGLTISGAPGVTFSGGSFDIRDIPSSQTVALRDLDLSGPAGGSNPPPRVVISNCDGMILLQDVAVRTFGRAPATISTSARVAFTRCQIESDETVTAVGSVVAFNDCRVDIEETTPPSINGKSALTVLAGTTSIADCVFEAPGGRSIFGTNTPVINIGGVLRVGGRDTAIRATPLPSVTTPIPAIATTDSPLLSTSVLVDPASSLVPANGSPAIVDISTGGNAVRNGRVASCTVRSTPNGEFLDLSGPANGMWFQFVSTPPVLPVLTSIGLVWSNKDNLTLMGMGVYSPGGDATLAMPPAPANLPDVLVLQTFVMDRARGYVGLPYLLQR